MSDATITPDQLRTVLLATELGNNDQKIDSFSWAGTTNSSYSFGILQFDIRKNQGNVQGFLRENGFTGGDIAQLSQRGGLSSEQVSALDSKLRAIPHEKIDQFTGKQLEFEIDNVEKTIGLVRNEHAPSAAANADAIVKDPRLQLAIADYENQFGAPDGIRHGTQFVSFLAGNSEPLEGGVVRSSDPLNYKDVQKFIDATGYGVAQHQKDASKDAAKSREERLDGALAKLGFQVAAEIGPARHAANEASGLLQQGSHTPAVQTLQAKLAELGYTDGHGRPLKADGDFGPATRDAVKAFQRDHHLSADGRAGSATQQAIRASLQPLRQDNPGPLPAVSAMSSLPAGAPGLDDPRNAFNANHALFNDLKQRFPDASDNRLLQFTAACHTNGITDQNLKDVRFDQQQGVVSFGGREEGQPFRGATVDVKEPSPQPMQSIQQIQQFDQHQLQIQTTVQAQIAQTNAQAQQGPVPGGH